MHRQWHSLLKELRDAEQALGQDPSEANYSWLQDVKARLGLLDARGDDNSGQPYARVRVRARESPGISTC